MKVYWKYEWSHIDGVVNIYERDTEKKTERMIYNSRTNCNDSDPWLYQINCINDEREEYPSATISVISKEDAFLEMI
jgi:hypothetical protein